MTSTAPWKSKTRTMNRKYRKSNSIAKLDGTYRLPTAAAAVDSTSTNLQQSIFNAPPSSHVAVAPSTTTNETAEPKLNGVIEDTRESHGVKRGREEESEDEGAPMEEGDSDVPMEASSDEDST
ncbi:MAG: hypothetical protein Q9167_006993 [Letrouitia subvulpina]